MITLATMDELRKKYNLDISTTTAYGLIYSYAKDATQPVIFSHYAHEHRSIKEINYNKQYDYCTLYFFMSGKFGFIFDNTICNPSYGDVVIIRDREKFTSCFYTTSFVDYYEINFPAEFFNGINLINPFTKIFYDRKAPNRNLVILNNLNREAIIDILKKIDALANEKSEFRDFLAYSYIIRIAEIICEQQSENTTALPPRKIPQALKDALNYIHAHYTTLGGIDEISENCNITGTYLARLFKKFLLCSPNEYISELRISHAKYLLQSGSNLTDACYNSGFSNYNYFISKFKTVTGTTPAKWKNEYLTHR